MNRAIPLAVAFAASLLAGGLPAVSRADEGGGTAARLEKAEPRFVCMVNDKRFDREQIAVEVEGRTYYGCCQMCKKALAERPELRQAVDPVSGHPVDKATAVIGVDGEGTAYYFESEETFATFQAGTAASS